VVRLGEVIWMEWVIEKLWVKHGVRREEVHEVLEDRPKIMFVEKGDREGEDVYLALGRTEPGRYLSVFFVLKKDRQALVLSARDMAPAERRRYERT
jgi:uncharacterized DUF497 family protein